MPLTFIGGHPRNHAEVLMPWTRRQEGLAWITAVWAWGTTRTRSFYPTMISGIRYPLNLSPTWSHHWTAQLISHLNKTTTTNNNKWSTTPHSTKHNISTIIVDRRRSSSGSNRLSPFSVGLRHPQERTNSLRRCLYIREFSHKFKARWVHRTWWMTRREW